MWSKISRTTKVKWPDTKQLKGRSRSGSDPKGALTTLEFLEEEQKQKEERISTAISSFPRV